MSPNYPLSYEANSRCVWTVRGPVGHYLNLEITSMDLPRPRGDNCSLSGDFLQFRERNATSKQKNPVTWKLKKSWLLTTVENWFEIGSNFKLVKSLKNCVKSWVRQLLLEMGFEIILTFWKWDEYLSIELNNQNWFIRSWWTEMKMKLLRYLIDRRDMRYDIEESE